VDTDEDSEYFHMQQPQANMPMSSGAPVNNESNNTSPSITSPAHYANNNSNHHHQQHHHANGINNNNNNNNKNPTLASIVTNNPNNFSESFSSIQRKPSDHVHPRKKQPSGYQHFPSQPSPPQPMYQHQQPHHRSSHAIDAKNTASTGYGFFGYMLIGLSYFLVILTLPLSICSCIKIVKEYERAVIFRLGM
jgi:hypothetical protein